MTMVIKSMTDAKCLRRPIQLEREGEGREQRTEKGECEGQRRNSRTEERRICPPSALRSASLAKTLRAALPYGGHHPLILRSVRVEETVTGLIRAFHSIGFKRRITRGKNDQLMDLCILNSNLV